MPFKQQYFLVNIAVVSADGAKFTLGIIRLLKIFQENSSGYEYMMISVNLIVLSDVTQ